MANGITMNRILKPFHERLQMPQALTNTLQIRRLRRGLASRHADDARSQTHHSHRSVWHPATGAPVAKG